MKRNPPQGFNMAGSAVLHPPYQLMWKHEMASRSFAITPDGNRLAAGSEGHIFMLSDLGDLLWKHGHAMPLDIYMTPDGSRIAASVEYEGELSMLDGDGRLLWEFQKGGQDEVRAVAMTPDGSRVVALSGRLYMLDASGERLWEYEAKEGLVGTVAMTQDGSQVAAAGWDGSVYMLDGRGELLWEYGGIPGQYGGIHVIGSVVMTPDGSRVAAMPLYPGELHMLDGRGRLLWKHGGVDGARSVAMTPDGGRVAIVNYDDGQLEMLDGRGELLWRYGPVGWVRSFAISPDGNRVAVVSYEDGELSVLDGDGEMLWKLGSVGRVLSLPEHQFWSLAWTQDGSGLAMGCWGGGLYLFKEGAVDRQALEPVGPSPGPWARTVQRMKCWAGLHHGTWEYQARSACDQILVCPNHGSTRGRTDHRWTRTNETFGEDLDGVDEFSEAFHQQKTKSKHYRCRRCGETRTETELAPESYG